MKLYKIVSIFGGHTRSVFPPKKVELPKVPEWADLDPWRVLVQRLMLRGYTYEEATVILQAWAYHAKYDLNQLSRGVIIYCQMMERRLPPPDVPKGVSYWPFVLVAAALAAIGLAIYLWEDPTVDDNYRKPGHPWVYLMSYRERLWQAEIKRVTGRGVGFYDRGGEYDNVLVAHERNIPGQEVGTDLFNFSGALVDEGRPLVFWHRFYWHAWTVFYCGVLEQVRPDIYILREGGRDPYKQRNGWIRPGDQWGTPGYEGAWKGFGWWWM